MSTVSTVIGIGMAAIGAVAIVYDAAVTGAVIGAPAMRMAPVGIIAFLFGILVLNGSLAKLTGAANHVGRYARTALAAAGLTASTALIGCSPDSEQAAKHVINNGKAMTAAIDDNRAPYDSVVKAVGAKYKRNTTPTWYGFMNDDRELQTIGAVFEASARVNARAAKDGVAISPQLIIGALANEGRILDVDQSQNLNGFWNLGLDWFGAEYSRLEKAGYLTADFKTRFTTSQASNEHGTGVTTATFKSVSDAIEAVAATLALRQREFQKDWKRKGDAPLSNEARRFFSYAYYNAGEGAGADMLAKAIATGPESYIKKSQHQAAINARVVLSGVETLETAGLFDKNPQGKYFWSK